MHPTAHRNRTLVVNNGTNTPDSASQTSGSSTPTAQQSAPAGWVSKRDRHMQLINTAVYDKKVQERQKAMEETAQQKQLHRAEKERSRVMGHFQRTTAPSAQIPGQAAAPRIIEINGLQFRVAPDGSKLIRVLGKYPQVHGCRGSVLSKADGSNNTAEATPKQAKIAGVTFYRSKNGNLYRNSLVKSQRYRKITGPDNIEERGLMASSYRAKSVKKSQELCPRFTATGTAISFSNSPLSSACPSEEVGHPYGRQLTHAGSCSLGNRCRYTHDFNKLAICKDFLRHGKCAAGEEACNLSHDPTPNRVPACTHFLRGNCTNPDCRYAHIHTSPTAPVCRAFATIGYCEKGAECAERHVNECPDYANTGVCRNKKCRLPHVDTAGNLRKAAALKAGKAEEDQSSDLSSEEEDYEGIDSDDVDSDGMEDIVMGHDDGHELSQQQDFVSFA